ncbi:tubulin polyglutamylase TTLL5 [Xenopus laevis]|uniref:Tubulin--tyrosine ligase-like protein 5 n=2 Tax=Xenopus laevis TaxID=8355 RepID=A0A974C7U5_XENLA|nr:tubulin polyglutamylase TTLL5 [Xenopus laevis]OCT68171.1 hypothetical protein XELAEV_18039467mg [Xenopus laevis]
MPEMLPRGQQDELSEEDDSKKGEYSCILWTGGPRKVPIVMFHAEGVLHKNLSLRAVGERYRLSYKIVRTDSRLVRSVLSAHGFQEVNANSNDFNIMWTGSHIKPHIMRSLTNFQKVNHFPRSYELTRKDRLYKNVQRMQQNHGFKNFHLLPETYLLPAEYQNFCNAFAKDRGPWIVKPVASSRGRGVYLINSPSHISMEDNILVSRYIGNPLLIDGFKFDVRLYVLITSYDPLVIYLYEEGLTRFATAKYERSAKQIKNQFMHLTNYSVNKKSRDYVSCDDPDVEDYGNKWSMSAMLRYLKQDGTDTTALMAQVEDLIIKTIISGELPIASACKSLIIHRGNCFELYGFDVLFDGNMKPWLLEVNLSPSLACDAPLDLKVKASMISDMFTLVGVECQDPQQKFGHASTSFYDKRTQKSTRQRPLSASDIDTGLQGGNREKPVRHTSCLLGLSIEELKILRRVQDEDERRGGFVRIFPRHNTWQLYGSFLEYKTSLNYMLATHLFPNRAAVNDHCGKNWDTRTHAALYERKLVSLHLRRARHRGLTRRTGLLHASQCTDQEQSSKEQEEEEEEEQDENHEELEVVQEKVLTPPDSTKIVIPPPPPRISLMDILKKGADLSKVQARNAFSCYLQRVKSRLQTEQEPESVQPKEEEQIELVMRFLQRAAANLQRSLPLSLPGHSVPYRERRKLLAKLLGNFVALYNQETQQMRSSEETQSNEVCGVNPDDFQAFVADASESELEEVLTFYTQKNKSASVFLGTPSNANRRETGKTQGSQDRLTCERSVVMSSASSHPSVGKPGYSQECNVPDVPIMCTNSAVNGLPENCLQRTSTTHVLSNGVSSCSTTAGSNGMHSSPAKLSVTPGTWAQTGSRPQSSSLGTFSSFQSAAQIYSQKLRRPSSTRSASSHQSALRSRCSSAGLVKELEVPYNESAVAASLQRLAERQSGQQYSRQLRLLTQQLTSMNIKDGAFGSGGFRHSSAKSSCGRAIHTNSEAVDSGTRDIQTRRSAWASDQESNAFTLTSEVPLQHQPHQMHKTNKVQRPDSASISLTNQTCPLLPTPPANQKQSAARPLSATRIVRVAPVDRHGTPTSTIVSDFGTPSQGSVEAPQIIFARARAPAPRIDSKGQRK